MFILFGSRLYGKVDNIEGLGHVATKFGHLYYFPLIPTGSFFVTGQAGDDWEGAKVRLNFKSILKSYLQAFLIVVVIGWTVLNIGMISSGVDNLLETVLSVLGELIPIGLLIGVRYLWYTASYETAMQIANDLGFDERLKVFIDLHYERITEDEADRRMDALHSELADLEDLEDEIAASGLDRPIELS